MIRKPMKAPGEGVDVDTLASLFAGNRSVACSAKLDGIRALHLPEGVMSASLKRLGNEYMQTCLADATLIGLDGELVVGLPHTDLNDPEDDVYNRTSGAIRRKAKEPDFKYYVFDCFRNTGHTYLDRWINGRMKAQHLQDHPFIVVLEQRICTSVEEALEFEAELIQQGYEGMMARSLEAGYKQGRATLNQGLIYKRKPLEQDEGVIIEVFEQMENQNEKFKNELGNSTRSSHQENKVGKNTLGGFVLQSKKWDTTFRIGTFSGGTVEWRQKMWNMREQLIGQICTFTYQAYGSINAPRIPVGKAELRDPADMTDY